MLVMKCDRRWEDKNIFGSGAHIMLENIRGLALRIQGFLKLPTSMNCILAYRLDRCLPLGGCVTVQPRRFGTGETDPRTQRNGLLRPGPGDPGI